MGKGQKTGKINQKRGGGGGTKSIQVRQVRTEANTQPIRREEKTFQKLSDSWGKREVGGTCKVGIERQKGGGKGGSSLGSKQKTPPEVGQRKYQKNSHAGN